MASNNFFYTFRRLVTNLAVAMHTDGTYWLV